jgi:hypothetical protein
MKSSLQDPEKLKRKHSQAFLLNDLELEALLKYCKKYKVKNKSKFIRETIFSAVLKKFDEDYPTLFDLNELLPVSTANG